MVAFIQYEVEQDQVVDEIPEPTTEALRLACAAFTEVSSVPAAYSLLTCI
jgi:hypothetical protein